MDSSGVPEPTRLAVLPATDPAETPAHERARDLLAQADLELAQGTLARAQVLSDIARGWATLALTEAVPDEHRWRLSHEANDGGCPTCPSELQVVMPTDWQGAVEAGSSVPVIGCGNPWHYIFPTLHSQG